MAAAGVVIDIDGLLLQAASLKATGYRDARLVTFCRLDVTLRLLLLLLLIVRTLHVQTTQHDTVVV